MLQEHQSARWCCWFLIQWSTVVFPSRHFPSLGTEASEPAEPHVRRKGNELFVNGSLEFMLKEAPPPSWSSHPHSGYGKMASDMNWKFGTVLQPFKCVCHLASTICCCCSVTKSCLTHCDPMDCSAPGFPVLHYFLEFVKTHVHWVDDAIQPCHPLSSPSLPALIFPSIRVFSNESSEFFASGGQSIGALASALVLPMNIQGWFPLVLTGFILQFNALSRVFSSTTIQRINSLGLSLLHSPTLTPIHDYWKKHSFDYMGLCQQSDVFLLNTLSMFVTAFLPRRTCLLISRLQSLSTVILEPKKIKCHFPLFPLLFAVQWWDWMPAP